LYGIKIWTHHSFVSSQITCLTDRETDGQRERILIARPLMQCNKKHRAMYRLQLGTLWREDVCWDHPGEKLQMYTISSARWVNRSLQETDQEMR